MKEANRFLTTLFVALLIASSLPGCATGPILADGRLQFPQYNFSVESPSREWMTTESKVPGEFVAWLNTVTKSRLGIQAHRVLPDGSLHTVVEAFKEVMTKGITGDLERKFPGAEARRGATTFTIEEEKEINFGGRMFYRVILNYGDGPAKFFFYFFKGKEFIFSLSLTAVLEYYEKDLAVLEQMARGVSVLM